MGCLIVAALIYGISGITDGGNQERMAAYRCARAAIEYKQGPDAASACFTSRGLTPPWDE